MNGQLNPRIVGASLVGIGLVAGAYVYSNFGVATPPPQAAAVAQAATPARVAIAVTDNDQNGIEDWRDKFVETAPIILSDEIDTTPYSTPDTLTGQTGIALVESFMNAQLQGSLGTSNEEIAANAVASLTQQTELQFYDVPDITQLNTWEDDDILTYANTIALAIQNNNDVGIDANELFILQDILEEDQTDRLTDLQVIATAYQNMRDATLRTPVPRFLVKEHLDLINTYHAIYTDIDAMTLSIDDPAVSLLRLQRYEDDALALSYALRNMYTALVPYADLATADDPAILFATFSPHYTNGL